MPVLVAAAIPPFCLWQTGAVSVSMHSISIKASVRVLRDRDKANKLGHVVAYTLLARPKMTPCRARGWGVCPSVGESLGWPGGSSIVAALVPRPATVMAENAVGCGMWGPTARQPDRPQSSSTAQWTHEEPGKEFRWP